MKRLLPILFLLCLAAGDEIPGWKAATGKWSYDDKKEEIGTEGAGNLESAVFPVGDFEMDFQICIDDYTDPHNMAGVSFHVSPAGRYKLSFRSPNCVMFDKSWKEGEATTFTMKSLASQAMSIAKGKWMPVKLTVRGEKMQARIGKKLTLQAADPQPLPPGTLELSTLNTTARYKIKKINVKDK